MTPSEPPSVPSAFGVMQVKTTSSEPTPPASTTLRPHSYSTLKAGLPPVMPRLSARLASNSAHSSGPAEPETGVNGELSSETAPSMT